ncbi:hypothetical protein [Henriciella sp.]|uniref:hypothetical protein n=1 Tax=Henriciella sp. TaxID=1968823 RepID=UPI00260EFD44|nr:hypothetical protein [Henriciella sp.]
MRALHIAPAAFLIAGCVAAAPTGDPDPLQADEARAVDFFEACGLRDVAFYGFGLEGLARQVGEPGGEAAMESITPLARQAIAAQVAREDWLRDDPGQRKLAAFCQRADADDLAAFKFAILTTLATTLEQIEENDLQQ